MTFIQLEYIIALDTYRHFAEAAKKCFVTQPTLSMQIQKLEEDLHVKIFDRSKQPVVPTENGIEIIQQAKKIMYERNQLQEIIANRQGVINGELRLGIIPTLAPYLLPLLVPAFIKKYPDVKLFIQEFTTDILMERLRSARIDVGILVTPLSDTGFKEDVLFYEELVAYVSSDNVAYKKQYILSKDIDPSKLLLLEEGHCFRSQIINLCELRKHTQQGSRFEYEAGSLETLRRMVDNGDGLTVLPELATIGMNAEQQMHLRYFKKPAPVREVSLVTHRDFVKRKLVEALRETVMDTIPQNIKKNNAGKNKQAPVATY